MERDARKSKLKRGLMYAIGTSTRFPRSRILFYQKVSYLGNLLRSLIPFKKIKLLASKLRGVFAKVPTFLGRVSWRKKTLLQEYPARKVKPGETVILMKGITKRFPGVVANDHIDFEVKAGEIHALLGENGAGKTTLMNIMYGILKPDEGEIHVYGKKVTLKSPKDAIDLGIGMVHQHFMLIPMLTVTENIILGSKSPKRPFLDFRGAKKRIIELSEKYGLKVDPDAKIWQLSVGERQRVEILKALYRGARILILDEPTSVLTPWEVKELMELLKRMAKEGMAVIPFITHKLPEVMAISDRVTVLRGGKVVATLRTKETNEKELVKKMVKHTGPKITKRRVKKGKVVLEVRELRALSDRGLLALKDVSFSVREGEIFGIAGVAGNGQRELVEVVTGLRRALKGNVLMDGKDITNRAPMEVIKAGVAHIPEERIGMGLAPNLSVSENLLLKSFRDPSFLKGLPFVEKFGARLFLNRSAVDRHVEKLISEYNIVTPSKHRMAKLLSGGNIQRLILAREISTPNLRLLVASYPTRGLDVAATNFIRNQLLSLREKGVAILLISEDLNEILSLSDKVAVMFEGRIMGVLSAKKANVEKIGLMMAGRSE